MASAVSPIGFSLLGFLLPNLWWMPALAALEPSPSAMFPSCKTQGNRSTRKDRNVEKPISTTLGQCPHGGPGGAGGFHRAHSASRVMRESPQLQPLKKPEAIFKSVKLRRPGAWEVD